MKKKIDAQKNSKFLSPKYLQQSRKFHLLIYELKIYEFNIKIVIQKQALVDGRSSPILEYKYEYTENSYKCFNFKNYF